MSERHPIIGISTSEINMQVSNLRGWKQPQDSPLRYALAMTYPEQIMLHGGLPIMLPPGASSRMEDLLAICDGVLLTGGPDINPARYNALPHPADEPAEERADEFEFALLEHASRMEIPTLGICRGLQLMNVARGGSLHQHLPDLADTHELHRKTPQERHRDPSLIPLHTVILESSNPLQSLFQRPSLLVNSYHHQGINRLGERLVAIGHTEDGLIEAIYDPNHLFWIGVQWHAEAANLSQSPQQGILFQALIEAARQFRASAISSE